MGAQAFTTVLSGLGERLVEELKAVTPVGVTGHLRDQTSYEVSVGVQERQDIVYTLSVIQASESLGFMYRPIVVRGRSPGRQPPVQALLGWVRLKWGLDFAEELPAAYKLARHIAVKGTKANEYPRIAVERATSAIQQAANDLGQELAVIIADID